MSAPRNEAQELQLEADIQSFRHDPYGFVMYAYPWGEGELAGKTPREWQVKKLKEVGEKLQSGEMNGMEAIQLAISSGHGIGKSALVVWLIEWAMSTMEDTKGVVTANTEKQLVTKTWAELAKWHRMAINSHWFELTATALFSRDSEHEKTWRMDMVPWSERNTEAFAGLHNEGKRVCLFFDEASAIPDVIWEVSEGALTDANTEIMWFAFGNPTRNTGRFRECFARFKHRWSTDQIDSRTVEATNKAQLEKWVEDYGLDSDFVKVRVRGMFPSASAKQFISIDDVDAAFGRELKPSQYKGHPKILTLDPAWEGDDELVIGMRQGLKFNILRKIAKNDNDVEIANILMRIEDEEGANAVFIDAGYGTGIVSVGRTLGRNWILVWFSGKSTDPGCLNKRAEMWKAMRDWLKEGGSIQPDPELHEELIGPETVARVDGLIQIESKKDMKARGLRSPNKADALALTFAFPVSMPDYRSGNGGSTGRNAGKAITERENEEEEWT